MVNEDVKEEFQLSETKKDEKSSSTLTLESTTSNFNDDIIVDQSPNDNDTSLDAGSESTTSPAEETNPIPDDFGMKDDEKLSEMLEEHVSVWEDENPNESIYEIEVNNILENEFENETESFENETGENRNTLAIASCSRSGSFRSLGSQSPSDFHRFRRSRYGSDSSRPSSECWSPGYRNSLSTNLSGSDKYRRPSYTCTPFHNRRHYAVRRKTGPNLR